MQTSLVIARSCSSDLAASNASDAVAPGRTLGFRCNDCRAGAPTLDRLIVARPGPARVWRGEEFRLGMERPDAESALEVAWRVDVASLPVVPDLDHGSRGRSFSACQGLGLYVGPFR